MDKYKIKFSLIYGIIFIVFYHFSVIYNLLFPYQIENYRYRDESTITWQTKLVNESDSIKENCNTYLLFSEQSYNKNRENNEVRIYSSDKNFTKIRWLFIAWHLILIGLYILILLKLKTLLNRLKQSIVFTPENYKILKQTINVLSIIGMMHFMGVGLLFLLIYAITGLYVSIHYNISFITLFIVIVFFQIFINLIMQYFIKANKIEVDQSLTV